MNNHLVDVEAALSLKNVLASNKTKKKKTVIIKRKATKEKNPRARTQKKKLKSDNLDHNLKLQSPSMPPIVIKISDNLTLPGRSTELAKRTKKGSSSRRKNTTQSSRPTRKQLAGAPPIPVIETSEGLHSVNGIKPSVKLPEMLKFRPAIMMAAPPSVGRKAKRHRKQTFDKSTQTGFDWQMLAYAAEHNFGCKYNVYVQMEIAKECNRSFFFSRKTFSVQTQDGTGIEDLIVTPTSTKTTMHMRFV